MNSNSLKAPPRIVVLGSLNMDVVVRVPHAPIAGETLQGHSIHSIPGGKGGNQAVSCARQGALVSLIGCVGADANGEALRQALHHDGIDTSAVTTHAAAPTGTALVMVEDTGQNRIVVIAGANACVEIDEVALAAQLQDAAFLIAQFETPMAQVTRAMTAAHRAGCRVLLNPSPVQPINDALWPLVDTLVVNEVEAQTLSGQTVDSPRNAAIAGKQLHARGVARVVITLGSSGAVVIDADGARHHPALVVTAIDTTAAGDTFLGALAVTLACGTSLDEGVRLGIRSAALCVTQQGAQTSIPLRDAVLLSAMPPDWKQL